MRFLLTISLALWLTTAQAESVRMLVQNSPLAGSQFYALETFWSEIKVGDALALIREPDNKHDRNAIRVEWQGHQLGYVPRAQNRAVAAAMDAGDRLSARVSSLSDNKNPWQRLAFEVFVEL
ncbi:HIRAN domain-containing protein [Ferribacterium limneticum]|uniref:HIRAN domain-containing protein n=1 Tax=Ferribacterium limneticum TaxID=76259 RepID=UPI001CFA76C3|nr:HIRAN domain-containing protein [Ferribacterium limneticum]UCV18516.1 HIRAN domain-containing protein [Ferribacterium limneticum]